MYLNKPTLMREFYHVTLQICIVRLEDNKGNIYLKFIQFFLHKIIIFYDGLTVILQQ